MSRPLKSLEDLVIQSLDQKRLREQFVLPHPLFKFAANGVINDGPCADAVLEFVHNLTMDEPGSPRHRSASWFLLESDKAFFYACAEAGIDAGRLRRHLTKCQAGEIRLP